MMSCGLTGSRWPAPRNWTDRDRRGAAGAQLGAAQGLGGVAVFAEGPVELVHESRGGRVLDGPQRGHHGTRAIGEKAVVEAEHAFAAQRAAVAGGAAG